MVRRVVWILFISPVIFLSGGTYVFSQSLPFITIASTTSTENSGLFSNILPIFEATEGISVRVVAVGTGQAIRLAERGDADVLLVHHKPSEQKFVAQGYGVKRYDVMFNDFVIVGPSMDPANISRRLTAVAAFRSIAARQAIFVSRGDNSGTHKVELAFWKEVPVEISKFSGKWYREVGAGMGAALNIAAGMNAYVLVDRATWISFKNKGSQRILMEGDPALFNQYGVVAVDPKRHSHIKAALAEKFVRWVISAEGQRAILNFKVAGQRLFTPNANKIGRP